MVSDTASAGFGAGHPNVAGRPATRRIGPAGRPSRPGATSGRRSGRAGRARTACLLIAASLVAGGTVGCGSSGRELREVAPGETAPPRSTSSTAPTLTAPTTAAAVGFALLPDGWDAGGPLPIASSCDDEGQSPALRWQGVDPTLDSLALVVIDPDADGFVHWVVTGMTPADGSLPAGAAPAGTVGANSADETGWFPLCPPPGESHTYEFTLLGFATPPVVDPAVSPEEAAAALLEQSSTRSLVTGAYER
jgi:phosphatidylethanolamine-binding protein (PEBP) family uncharacterized protein